MQAVAQLLKSPPRKEKGFTLGALATVWQRYLAFGTSTSGIEQSFSKMRRLTAQRGDMSETRDFVILKVATDRVAADEDEAPATGSSWCLCDWNVDRQTSVGQGHVPAVA